MAEDFLALPHRWMHHPMPKTSAEDLRECMNDTNHNGYPKKSNNIDYAGRAVSKNFKERTSALISVFYSFRKLKKTYRQTDWGAFVRGSTRKASTSNKNYVNNYDNKEIERRRRV